MSDLLQSRSHNLDSSGIGASGTGAAGLNKRPFLIGAAILAGILCIGVARHVWRNYEASSYREAQETAVPSIRTAKVVRQDGPIRLELPGQTLAINQARLFARATGYIAERRVDIGSRVKKGDLLARIAAPDLDHQYAQAQAQLLLSKAQLSQSVAQVEQTRANLELAKITHARTATLVKQKFESKQNDDNARANVQTQAANLASAEAGVEVARANIAAQQATVDRLKQLTEFESVVAPFDGVVTARNIEVGDLVTADAGGATPLFSVARDDVLRVQVSVPQAEAAGLVDGLEAEVVVPEAPGKIFKGRIARNASALDAATRTLLVEVDVTNKTGDLRPGLFTRVRLNIPRAQPSVTAPAQAILFRAEGPQLAVVGKGDVVQLRRIVIARDFGTTVEIKDGLAGDETIVLDPPASLRDGMKISVKM
jgi:RND family efflux transporter MFP subunit